MVVAGYVGEAGRRGWLKVEGLYQERRHLVPADRLIGAEVQGVLLAADGDL